MPCFHPQTGYRTRSGRNENGLWPITFNVKEGYHDLPVKVPCSKCIGCRLIQSQQWAIRCMHEAQSQTEKGNSNCFITLTYNEKNLPRNKSVNVKHYQDFMKRLRKKFQNQTIRFFHCGEYGTTCKNCGLSQNQCHSKGCGSFTKSLGRPHYHAILFGIDFDDKELLKEQQTGNWYTSHTLDKLWGKGYCTIGQVTYESAAYVARYVTKKISGEMADEHYQGRKKEYITMSRRPGIAKHWYDKYKEDVYQDDFVLNKKGSKLKPPRYYDKMYEIDNPKDFKSIRNERSKRIENMDPDESWYTRLEEKEKVKTLNTKQLTRKLEQS